MNTIRFRQIASKISLTTDLQNGISNPAVVDALSAQHCGSHSSKGSSPRWYCVETQPAGEYAALCELSMQGFRTHLPTEVRRRPKKAPVIRPVFPRYMFVQFDIAADPWRKIVSTRGVKRLFSAAAERPTPVPVGIVEALMAKGRPGDGVIDDQYTGPEFEPLRPDIKLKVMAGPFAERYGICRMSTRRRVVLLLDVFGCKTAVEVRRQDVQEVAA